MIIYTKNSFGVNLIFRVHGSAVYRAVVPALIAVGFYYFFEKVWYKEPREEVLHPYALGLLIGGITFLIIFRLTNSYGRYWEAAGACYRMMSKWVDSAVHVAGYHLQSSQYDSIKPPSYRDYPELNAMYLTRDRERFKPIRRRRRRRRSRSSKTSKNRRRGGRFGFNNHNNSGNYDDDGDDDDDDDEDNKSQQSFVAPKGKMSKQRARLKSINSVINKSQRNIHNNKQKQRKQQKVPIEETKQQKQKTPTAGTPLARKGADGRSQQGNNNNGMSNISSSDDSIVDLNHISGGGPLSSSDDEFHSSELLESARSAHVDDDGGGDSHPTPMAGAEATTTTTTTATTATPDSPGRIVVRTGIRGRISSLSNDHNSRRLSSRNFESASATSSQYTSGSIGNNTGISNHSSDRYGGGESNTEKNGSMNDESRQQQQQPASSSDNIQSQYRSTSRNLPQFLTGLPRLDGGWGSLFDDGKTTYWPISSANHARTDTEFCKPDRRGFASRQGGRTPPLFLQELAHLTSLLTAVALSTLRNDIEGVESPIDVYEAGSPWPAVDPGDDEYLYDSKMEKYWNTFLYFCGKGRDPEARMRYNAARPLPVIGGVSDAEIQMLQMARGPYAKVQLCFGWLSEFIIREHLAGSLGLVGAPIISRVKQFIGDGMANYNMARKIMFIPFPFPHAQLSSLFVNLMVILIPLLMEQYTDDQAIGASLTFASVLCLSGVHEVARELENPFRNVPNELPVVTFQAEVNEALYTIYSGFHPDFFWERPREIKPISQDEKQPSIPSMIVEEEIGTGANFGSDEDDDNGLKAMANQNQSMEESDNLEVEKSDADLLRIVAQQGQILEQMLQEQNRLNRMIKKMMDEIP